MADDDFDDLGVAPVRKFPTMAQIGSDGPKVKVIYAKGKPQEQIKDTTGRLVLLRPVKLEHNVPPSTPDGKVGDRLSMDVIVLDGPPIVNVVDKDGEETFVFPEPLVPNQSAVLERMYSNHTVLIGQMKDQMTNGETAPGKWNYGRLMKLAPKNPGGNKPWAVGRAVDAKQNAEDRKIAAAWLKAHPEPDAFE